jgi:hypothetical protein
LFWSFKEKVNKRLRNLTYVDRTDVNENHYLNSYTWRYWVQYNVIINAVFRRCWFFSTVLHNKCELTNLLTNHQGSDPETDTDSGCSLSLASWRGTVSLSWESGKRTIHRKRLFASGCSLSLASWRVTVSLSWESGICFIHWQRLFTELSPLRWYSQFIMGIR